MPKLELVGRDWLVEEVAQLTEAMEALTPAEYNERDRYLPGSVTSKPGYIRYAINPFMREILDCADVRSPVHQVSVKKGVQITYSTLLESIVLYYADYIGTLPMMYITADKELATARIENNYIPMFNHSEKGDIIRSSDEGNTRKTGKTVNHLQFAKGAYLVPFGARNADKMRSYSIAVMLKDEIDAWPDKVGKDGDPDKLSDARCDGYSLQAKIYRGSTPLIEGSSKIQKAYLRGDQRKYKVPCRSCGHMQALRWTNTDKDTGLVGGFLWEFDEHGRLLKDTVRYCCQKCGHAHYEHDKEWLFSPDNGAKWEPTATAVEEGIRSYHLPALYSPIGMRTWWMCVLDYLDAYDPVTKRVKDIGKYQVFYNNILAEPFKVLGSRVLRSQVSLHKRHTYTLGQVPNAHAALYAGSPILFLTCQVDVHKSNLAVAVMGWTKNSICYLVDYWRFESSDDVNGCADISDPAWERLRQVIEEKAYTSDDGKVYRVVLTLVDAGFSNATVNEFCAEYESGVYPILGRERPAKNQRISEFAEFTTQAGTVGYRILVDHYKDRMAPVLRREWVPEAGVQNPYHFNAPSDTTDAQLKELTVETRREETDDRGIVKYVWYRPSGVDNELWDLLGYGYAAVEILAWGICIKHFELETVDWARFWAYLEEGELYFSDSKI